MRIICILVLSSAVLAGHRLCSAKVGNAEDDDNDGGDGKDAMAMCLEFAYFSFV